MNRLCVSLFICLLIAVGTESRRKFKAGVDPGCRRHRCFVNPCMLTSCVNPPNLECRPNYCGGCNADFYDPDSNELTECVETGRPDWIVYGQRTRPGRINGRRPRHFRRHLK